MENSKEVKVESVKAINKTTVEVTFNNAVTALDKGDVTVTNEKTGDKQYVKTVKLSEDKKSATIEFYDALADKTTYKVSIKDAGEATLEFAVGAPAKIEAKTTQTVAPKGDQVDLSKLDYKVFDANGLDITKDTVVAFETTATLGQDGKTITLADGQSAFVYITAKDGDKVIKSDRITVKAEAASIQTITDITVEDTQQNETNTKNVFEAENYKQNLVIQKGATQAFVNVAGENQYGKAVYPTAGIKFESLDNEIGLVDATTGKVTAFKEGVLPIKVTIGKLSKTVEVKVVADAKATSLKVKEDAITLSNKVTTGKTVEIELLDQYENVFEKSTEKATVKVLSGEKLVTVADKLTFEKGKANLKVTPATDAKAGEAVIEIDYDGIKATVKVTVTEAGAVDNYKVTGFEPVLDKNAKNKEETPNEMTLSVLPVDEKGVVTGAAVTNASYVVKDAEGKEVKKKDNEGKDVPVVTDNKLKVTDLKAGEYTLIAKVGTVEVSTQTFKVVDTSPQPTLSVKKSNFEIKAEEQTVELAEVFEVTYDGAVQSGVVFSDIKFTSSNSTVASADGNGEFQFTADGEATLVLHSATITIGEKTFTDFDLKNVPVKVVVTKDAVKAAELIADLKKVKIADSTGNKKVNGTIGDNYLQLNFDWSEVSAENRDLNAAAKLKLFEVTLLNGAEGKALATNSLSLGEEAKHKGKIGVSGGTFFYHRKQDLPAGSPVNDGGGTSGAWNKGAFVTPTADGNTLPERDNRPTHVKVTFETINGVKDSVVLELSTLTW